MDSKNARFTYASLGDMLGNGDTTPLKLTLRSLYSRGKIPPYPLNKEAG
jgi:hypothetical protein